jgi:hypothetical protein
MPCILRHKTDNSEFKNQKTVLMNTLQYGLVQPTAYNSPLFVDAETRFFNYNCDNGGFFNIGILLTQPPKAVDDKADN